MKNQIITQEIRAMPKTKATVEIQVAVKFGMQSKNCQNHGICEITMRHESEQSCAICYQATLLYNAKENALRIKFLKASISLLAQKKYFANNIFLMEENYYLSDALKAHSLNQEKDYCLTKGEYLVKNSKEYLSITFFEVEKSPSLTLPKRERTVWEKSLSY